MNAALVCGASGFIGRRLAAALRTDRVPVRVALRRPLPQEPGAILAPLDDPSALAHACAGIDAVFHCAGHAHAWAAADATLHRTVNEDGTRNLVEAAGRAGVRRFVFLSSVKAMGEPGEACADEEWPLPPLTPSGPELGSASAPV